MECVLCSFCAAAASAGMKIAFNSQGNMETPDMLRRGAGFVFGLLMNSMMLKFFVDSLKKRSAFATTVSTFALNFMASATFGIMFFGGTVYESQNGEGRSLCDVPASWLAAIAL
eukprot:GEMP01123494.1.p2 GENE.GEMP01123494.1~~GEMP01123494.1.p2  ORF type:complete len:114 (+),score=36.89 GEMP01123494.1:145-486(+)